MNEPSAVTDSTRMFCETEVGVLHPAEAFEQESEAPSVTSLHVIVDGDRDEEVTLLNPSTGASSEAPLSSGIPSASRQQQKAHARKQRLNFDA